MKAVIFVNGRFHSPETARQHVSPCDYLIAADGGARHAVVLGLNPHIVIGDLDSLSLELERRLKRASTQFLRFPGDKDKTDLELAIEHALEKGVESILLIAALGGRLDQSLANIMLLTLPILKETPVSILDGNQHAFLLRNRVTILSKTGDLVSILPLAGDAQGVSSEGLKWPLRDETLPMGSSRGMSNVMLNERAVIRLRQGLLLCVVSARLPAKVRIDFS
ncbi:thiamine diphosphokinase [candidate division KSB3 bacterium]|uniref:Thiamine diphosphokinase n=1 Tax=candidate division KSB3 bacterium TaxID=2044937 RepID=A0A2G6E2R1_9BACT|nr:MAG: thiamine diphosphokinase [candidate division KSB3 bacterium]PIE28715.1 MAG: thiamine diphosphokinase [candidate division KSB3 bacterium]